MPHIVPSTTARDRAAGVGDLIVIAVYIVTLEHSA